MARFKKWKTQYTEENFLKVFIIYDNEGVKNGISELSASSRQVSSVQKT